MSEFERAVEEEYNYWLAVDADIRRQRVKRWKKRAPWIVLGCVIPWVAMRLGWL